MVLFPRTLIAAFVVLSAGGLVGLDAWLFRGLLLPLLPYPNRPPGEYLLLTPRPAELVVSMVAGVGLAWAAYLLYMRVGRRMTCLAPLLLLGLPPLALLLLATPLRSYAGPWLFLGVDLRWWLVGAVAGLVLGCTLASTGMDAWARLWGRRWARVLWSDMTLAAVLAIASLAASPLFRYDAWLNGDEPKYVRFMETLYRGHGFDIEGLVPIERLPAGSGSCLSSNVLHAGHALRPLGEDLLADLRWILGQGGDPPPRSTEGKDMFLRGKRGGVYQIHNPGLAFVLFPTYFVDRAWLNRDGESRNEFPARLYATNTAILVLYVLWGIAVFRFLRQWSGDRALSWALTLVAMLSQPVAAFGYQYYPEVLAGLLIFATARYAAFSGSQRATPALMYGLATGFLPWLHVRFALPAVVLAAAVVFWPGRGRHVKIWFGAGLLVPLLAMVLYDYHVSGTPWPLFLFDDQPLFTLTGIVRGLTGYWLDRDWGLIAYAPVYLLALPGIWLAARRLPLPSLLLAALVVVLAVPSAGRDWKGGISTPMRLVVALVPVGIIAVAETWRTFSRARWFRAGLALLAVVSLHNGLLLNSLHFRHRPEMVGPGSSGWNVALVLPDLGEPDWLGGPLLALWAAVSVGLVLATAWRKPGGEAGTRRQPSWVAAIAVVVLVFGSVGSAGTALGGVDAQAGYLVELHAARDEALQYYLAHRDGLFWSSADGFVRMTTRYPSPAVARLDVEIGPSPARVGAAVRLRVDATGPRQESIWGLVVIDFGDGTPATTIPFVGRVRAEHSFERAGQYAVHVIVEPAGVGGADWRGTIDVTPPAGPGGLPQ